MGLARTPPLVDLNFVKTTQAVTDGTEENLLTLCLCRVREQSPWGHFEALRGVFSIFCIRPRPGKTLKNVESGRDSEGRAAFGSESLRLRRVRLGEMLLEERLVHKP
jgi:hypothetical protein